jgi:hypothetical protein
MLDNGFRQVGVEFRKYVSTTNKIAGEEVQHYRKAG